MKTVYKGGREGEHRQGGSELSHMHQHCRSGPAMQQVQNCNELKDLSQVFNITRD